MAISPDRCSQTQKFYRMFCSNALLTSRDVSDAPALGLIDEEISPMSQNEYDAAIAEFMRKKGITRCPTACAVPTRAAVSEADRAALSDYNAAKEAARIEKSKAYQLFAA